MVKATKTIPEIKAECDEAIWKAIVPMLVSRTDQYAIAAELDVSTSWMSRYLKKNVQKLIDHPKISDWSYRSINAAKWK